ncbi:hypothetical protein [Geothrix sp. SG200]|uniref:hypothetical protein n=1 Tax=Geothrix sp. SG200 TaxID=2922865 RepID=UPI001FADBA36|nr:hypothetical protein [Geothrix sp. SG200]
MRITPSALADESWTLKPFPRANGQSLMLPVTDDGRVLSISEDGKVGAGGKWIANHTMTFMVKPKNPVNGMNSIMWGINLHFKYTNRKIEQIIVEEIAHTNPIFPKINDNIPKLSSNMWSKYSTALININPSSVPWLYSKETTTFIFKVTARVFNQPSQTIYIPFSFDENTKRSNIQDAQEGKSPTT